MAKFEEYSYRKNMTPGQYAAEIRRAVADLNQLIMDAASYDVHTDFEIKGAPHAEYKLLHVWLTQPI